MSHYSSYDQVPNGTSYGSYREYDPSLPSHSHGSSQYPSHMTNENTSASSSMTSPPSGYPYPPSHMENSISSSSSVNQRYSVTSSSTKRTKATKSHSTINPSHSNEYYSTDNDICEPPPLPSVSASSSAAISSSSTAVVQEGYDDNTLHYSTSVFNNHPSNNYDDNASTALTNYNNNESRTTRACEACHRAKAKCHGDGIVPCSSCVRRNIECVYVEQKKRGPKTGALKALQVELNTLRAALKTGVPPVLTGTTPSSVSGTHGETKPSTAPDGQKTTTATTTTTTTTTVNVASDTKTKSKRNRSSMNATHNVLGPSVNSSVSNPTGSVPSSSHIVSNATTPKGYGNHHNYNSTVSSDTHDPYASYTPSSSSHHHPSHHYPTHSHHHYQHHPSAPPLQPLPRSSGNDYPIPEYTYYGTYHGIPPSMGAWITLPQNTLTNIHNHPQNDPYSHDYAYDSHNYNQEVCDFTYPHSEPIIASHENEVKYIRLYFLYSNAVLPMVCKTDFYYAGLKLRLWDMLASVCEDTVPVCDHEGGDCAAMSFAPLSAFPLQNETGTLPSTASSSSDYSLNPSSHSSTSPSTANSKLVAPSVRQASLLGALAGTSGTLTPSSPPLLTGGQNLNGMHNGLGSPNELRSMSPFQRLNVPSTAASTSSFLYGGDDDENAFVGSWQIGRRTTTTTTANPAVTDGDHPTHSLDNTGGLLSNPFLTGSSISNYHQQQNELLFDNSNNNPQQSSSSSSSSSSVLSSTAHNSSSSSLPSPPFLQTHPTFGSGAVSSKLSHHHPNHPSIITPVQSDDDNDENSAGHEVRKRIANLHPLPKGLLRPPKRYVRATPELVDAHLKRLSSHVLTPSALTQGRLEACKAAYYGVLAIGARMDLQPLLADAYFHRARKALSRCFDEPCIETISGSMLCAYYMCGVAATGDMLRAKLYISLANEMADGLETSVAAIKRRERINTFSSDRPKEQQQQGNTSPSNMNNTNNEKENTKVKSSSSSSAASSSSSKKRKVMYDLKSETGTPVPSPPSITPSSSSTDSGIPQDILLSVRFLAQMTSAYRSGTVPALRAVSINNGNGTNANDANEIDSPRGRVSRILAHVTDKTRRRVSTPDQLRRIAPQLLEALGEAERIDREFHVGAPMDFNTQAAIHTSRAVVLHACGDIEQALKYAEKALEVMNTELRHFLAYVCASVLVQLIPIFMAANRMDKVKIVISYLHDLSQMWPVGYVLLAKASRRVSYAQQQFSSSTVPTGTLTIKSVAETIDDSTNSRNGTKTSVQSKAPVTPLDRLASVTETFGEPVHDDDNDESVLSQTNHTTTNGGGSNSNGEENKGKGGETFIKTSLESFIASPVGVNNQSFLASLPGISSTTNTMDMTDSKLSVNTLPVPSSVPQRTLSDFSGLRTSVSTNSFGVPVRSSSMITNSVPSHNYGGGGGNGTSFTDSFSVVTNGPDGSISTIPPPPTSLLSRPKHSYSSNSIGATSTSSNNSRNSLSNNPTNTTLVGGLGWDIDDFLGFDDMPLPSPLGTPYAPLVLNNANNVNSKRV